MHTGGFDPWRKNIATTQPPEPESKEEPDNQAPLFTQ